jgi:hypothetical protein
MGFAGVKDTLLPGVFPDLKQPDFFKRKYLYQGKK